MFILFKSAKLHAFKKFKDTAEAVKSLTKLSNGEVPKDLKKFLKKNIISKEISDKLLCKSNFILFFIIIPLFELFFTKLGYEKEIAEAITEALDIKTTHGSEMLEVFRGIRSQLSNLISGINKKSDKIFFSL